MAAATTTASKPAPKPATAVGKPGIGISEVAERLGVQPRTLRAFIRTLDLGVGRGDRYRWTGMSDPAVKRIVKAWEQAGDSAA